MKVWLQKALPYVTVNRRGAKREDVRLILSLRAPNHIIAEGLAGGWILREKRGRLLFTIAELTQEVVKMVTTKVKPLQVRADVSCPETFFRSKEARATSRKPVQHPRGPMTPRKDRMVEAEQVARAWLVKHYVGWRVYKIEGSLDFLLSHVETKRRIWYEVKLGYDGLSPTQLGLINELRLTCEKIRGLHVA